MRIFRLLLVLTLVSSQIFAQNISRLEYFFDADPGVGNAIPVSVTPASTITNLQFSPNIAALSPGLHFLYIRSCNTNGMWSITNSSSFYKVLQPAAPVLNKLEYFFDTDPGFGNGSSITISSSVNVSNLVAGLNITTLNSGLHTLYLRSRDADGNWAVTNSQAFYKVAATTPANIVRVEYFIDTDPGFGKANSVSLTSGANLSNLSFTANTSGLNDGVHRLFIRSLDANGHWSITNVSNLFLAGPYTFIGNGDWNIASNWMHNLIPSTTIGNGITVIINHVPGGQSSYTGDITIENGGKLLVQPGKVFKITGNLIQ